MTRLVRAEDLQAMKQAGEKIACLTSYDACFARLQEQAGVDVLLVGDSLGMVLHGEETTLGVSMVDMIYHTRMVSRAVNNPLIISDMPYQSYTSPSTGLENAQRLVTEGGAHVVKLEGGQSILKTVEQICEHGIPVCGHLGLMPQSINEPGGYRVQARTEAAAEQLRQDAIALEQAGASCLVLECIPTKLAAEVSDELSIPTIGIGAGIGCDGQVLVAHDMLGMSPRLARFCRDFLKDSDSIVDAFAAYVAAVKDKSFPAPQHSFD
ncbi:MAG: 3-methyl-2-oxobutanoate hydroxymethyltransferase [Gammaproteobacteria bacterium]